MDGDTGPKGRHKRERDRSGKTIKSYVKLEVQENHVQQTLGYSSLVNRNPR